MAVVVSVKQNSIFKKRLKLDDIIKLSKLSYGVMDDNYRVEDNKIGKNVILYSDTRIARGIELSINDSNDITLIHHLPTSENEINKYYELLGIICKKVGSKSFIKDNTIINLNKIDELCNVDLEDNLNSLKELSKRIENKEYDHFDISCVRHMITIGKKEVEEFNNSVRLFEEFLHKKQDLDLYFAGASVYNRLNGNSSFGMFAIGSDIPSIVPVNINIAIMPVNGVKDWYVNFGDKRIIKYEDFINNIKNKEYYDYNHVIICLKKEEIDSLVDRYSTNIE